MMVRHLPGASYGIKGFGSSDCHCEAHLVFFPAHPTPPNHEHLLTYTVRGRRLSADEVEEKKHWAGRANARVTKAGVLC